MAGASMAIVGFFNPTSGALTSVGFDAKFTTYEDALAFAACFPKSVRARAYRISGGRYPAGVRIDLQFAANRATGARNDASIKRYGAVMRALAALHIQVIDGPQFARNQLPDKEAIAAAVVAL